MASPRIESLVARLEKGRQKTRDLMNQLTPEQWERVVYSDPPWTMRCLLAHFASAEVALLHVARDVAQGGAGAPDGFDFDSFNATEQERLRDDSPQSLLQNLDSARAATIDFARNLTNEQLDLAGNHPALGEVTLETLLLSIYGHQLMHMREVSPP